MSDELETPWTKIREGITELREREQTLESELASVRQQLADAAALFAVPKPARAARGTGKPRGPRKALGSGPTATAGPESGHPEETLPDGIEKRRGRYYRTGSKVGYTMLTMAIAAAEEAQGTGE